MQRSCAVFKEHGFELIGLEGDQFDMDRIKFGKEGREEDIEKYCTMLESMGRLGIRLLCYNFMAGIGWYRTVTDVAARGGALVSGFSNEDAMRRPEAGFAKLTEEQLWDNYAWFLERVLPVAERAGVRMALHPDDPPVSPLLGVPRILTSATAIRRALSLSTSTSHGLTFCQGTFTTMGEPVKDLVHEFGNAGRIFFVHIRDVAGNRNDFRETFHDDGPTDMPAMFRSYGEVCADVPVRSDHVPTMAGESNGQHGYGMKGNLFGIGYMKGIMDALNITTE